MNFASSFRTAEVETRPVGTLRQYVPELDGLRAIAVLVVILYHTDPQGAFRGGFIGVDLFFVLSAFLITSILHDEKETTGKIRLAQFYWRRMLRLMPPLLLFLTAYVAVAPLIVPGYPHLRDAMIAGAYLSNFAYVAEQIPPYIRHTWSLAAEEQFYLLWPAVLLVLMRVQRPALLLGAIWLNLTALRLTTDDWIAYYYGFLPHGSGLVLGAILFFLVRDRKLVLGPAHTLVAAAVLAIIATTADLHESAFVITVAEIASAVIIGTVMTNRLPMKLLAFRPLVTLGKLSYGLYLWHYPIVFCLRGSGNFWINFAFTLTVSLILAGLSYLTIERWARGLRAPDKPVAAPLAEATS
jgi:peptidoglycan/LPS O-acetylase OafA/YrhL